MYIVWLPSDFWEMQRLKQYATECLSPKIANKIFEIILTQFWIVMQLYLSLNLVQQWLSDHKNLPLLFFGLVTVRTAAEPGRQATTTHIHTTCWVNYMAWLQMNTCTEQYREVRTKNPWKWEKPQHIENRHFYTHTHTPVAFHYSDATQRPSMPTGNMIFVKNEALPFPTWWQQH